MKAKGSDSSSAAIDNDRELQRFEEMLTELKVRYEQYFMGVVVQPPEKLHHDTVHKMRNLRHAPFMKPAQRHLLYSLESRYKSYNDYWRRVLREKEEGVYHKDVFKANMRARHLAEDAAAADKRGVPKAVIELFTSYKDALERNGKDTKNVSIDKFQQVLRDRAKMVKDSTGAKKVTFSVVSRDGKVTLQVKPKQDA